MFKLLFLAYLATVGAEDAADEQLKLYTSHVVSRYHRSGLNLTTGELKRFAGHAMNMIGAKCPAVEQAKIFMVQKYMGKLIAKQADLVHGNHEQFKGLLQSMTTCTKNKVVAEATTASPKMTNDGPFRIFYPFHRLRDLWNTGALKARPLNEEPAETVASVEKGVDSGLLAPTEKSLEAGGSIKDPSVETATRRVIHTTIYVRPEDLQEGIRSSGGLANWIRNILSKVSGFFRTFSPFSGTSMRKRRDVSEAPTGNQRTVYRTDSLNVFEEEPTKSKIYQVYVPRQDDSKGKAAFGKLIDEMCRIYCDKCREVHQILNFKAASRELLTFLFKDDAGIEFASKKILDDDFMKSIQQCE